MFNSFKVWRPGKTGGVRRQARGFEPPGTANPHKVFRSSASRTAVDTEPCWQPGKHRDTTGTDGLWDAAEAVKETVQASRMAHSRECEWMTAGKTARPVHAGWRPGARPGWARLNSKKTDMEKNQEKLNEQSSGQGCTDSRPMLLDRVESSFRQYKEALKEFYHADRAMCVAMYLIHDMVLSGIMKDKIDAVQKAMEEKKERGQSAE